MGQTRKKRAAPKKPAATIVEQPAPEPSVPVQNEPVPPKRNERPNATSGSGSTPDKPVQRSSDLYRYEFTQPDFVISKITIEHDETGKGTISFVKRGDDDAISDPITITSAALERINGAYAALNFLDSRDEYQYERDYSHLGNSTFTLRKGGKERAAKFNFTQNKDAKVLADEYRKLGQQFVWIFDITVARENQPLEAPRLLDSLDDLMRRNEISDQNQMKPLLMSLADDERIPLIARNHATRLIKRIEKVKK
ncbi:MAG TPA: hypothetical protein VJL58_10790 [Pyrinomonadaceae bacterium]|nr:hypothetical protein [Pyrinomonadaceae bacterium]